MTRVYELKFSRQEFSKLPETEQVLLVLFSHVLNEITIIQKLIIASGTGNLTHEMVVNAQFVQASVLIRSLITKIFEAWELYKVKVLSSPNMRSKRDSLSEKGKLAESELKRNFGKNKKLAALRNNFAVHYSKPETASAILDALKSFSEKDSWSIYLSPIIANSCFFISELAVTKSMLDLFDKDVPLKAELELRDLVLNTSGFLGDLFYAWVEILLEPLISQAKKKSIKVRDGYDIRTFFIPFFIDSSKN